MIGTHCVLYTVLYESRTVCITNKQSCSVLQCIHCIIYTFYIIRPHIHIRYPIYNMAYSIKILIYATKKRSLIYQRPLKTVSLNRQCVRLLERQFSLIVFLLILNEKQRISCHQQLKRRIIQFPVFKFASFFLFKKTDEKMLSFKRSYIPSLNFVSKFVV